MLIDDFKAAIDREDIPGAATELLEKDRARNWRRRVDPARPAQAAEEAAGRWHEGQPRQEDTSGTDWTGWLSRTLIGSPTYSFPADIRRPVVDMLLGSTTRPVRLLRSPVAP